MSSSALVRKLVSPEKRALQAYHVPSRQGMVKLDAMENPYLWPNSLIPEWQAKLAHVEMNRYPDPKADGIKSLLRSVLSLSREHCLLLGNGSDELIQLLLLAVGGEQRVVMTPSPSFSMYEHLCTVIGLEFVSIDLEPTFRLNTSAFLDAIERYNPALIFLAYPNNPTGNLFDTTSMEQIIEAAPGLVVVDEAYWDFAGKSLINRIVDYPNLVVLRTLSKVGFAGLRLGYMVASEPWISEFEKFRLPYNINVLTQASVEFALAHYDVFRCQIRKILDARESLAQGLATLSDIEMFASDTNFILVRVPVGRATEVFEGLVKQGILVKKFDGTHVTLRDCLRVTVGTHEQNASFLRSLQPVISNL